MDTVGRDSVVLHRCSVKGRRTLKRLPPFFIISHVDLRSQRTPLWIHRTKTVRSGSGDFLSRTDVTEPHSFLFPFSLPEGCSHVQSRRLGVRGHRPVRRVSEMVRLTGVCDGWSSGSQRPARLILSQKGLRSNTSNLLHYRRSLCVGSFSMF